MGNQPVGVDSQPAAVGRQLVEPGRLQAGEHSLAVQQGRTEEAGEHSLAVQQGRTEGNRLYLACFAA